MLWKQVRLYSRASQAFSTYEFFTTHQWRFISNNAVLLMDEMSVEDQNIFYFDVRKIQWQSYFETYILGVRLYVFKDDASTLPLARRNLNTYDLFIIVFLLWQTTYSLRFYLFFLRLYWIKFMVIFLVFVGCISLFSKIFYFL